MKVSAFRTARIFLSSTFRDFGEERDLLVRKVFPSLRSRLKDRFVELVDVDLRWGITAEQAERGEVLPICLAEIDRSRPFFVGLLGERYGWVPEKGKYPPELVEQRPWLKKHQGGKSVTELEILHGVLNNPKMAGRALFYFRSAAYAKKKGGDYLLQSAEDRTRQQDLKARVRESGFPVVRGYKDPEALAKRLEKDLWKILDEMYPADEVPDAFTREGFRHEAYAVPRRRLFLGGEGYIEALDAALAEGKQRILVEGASGGGKSALIANWLEKRGRKHRKELVHVHYLGATAEASDPQALVRRLIEAIKRLTESTEEITSDPQALYDSLSTWLAIAHAYAGKRKTKVLIVLDALNGLRDLQDLRWFPEFLPERVRMVVSCLPGQVHEALLSKGDWQRVEVTPLDTQAARDLFVAYLRRYNKELPNDLLTLALDHPLSTNPLFLRTLAEELRLFGVHEQLKDRLDHYLTSKTVDDLFERVLERVEGDCGTTQVRKAMEGIWASRAGLSEHEIQGFANLKPAEWAPIRHALDDSLLESGGRITFAHDYMRLAVSDRYLKGNNTLQYEGQSPEAIKLRRRAHIALAKWFDTRHEEERAASSKKGKISKSKKASAPQTRTADARSAEEVPWQYQQARDWKSLQACLTRRDMFEAVYDNRSEQELLSYWIDIEKNTGTRIETQYTIAWKRWKLKKADEATGNLASRLSTVLRDSGRIKYSLTYHLARKALILTEKYHGDDSIKICERLHDLAKILMLRASLSDAASFLKRALLIIEKTNLADSILSAILHNSLGWVSFNDGDFCEAEGHYRKALEILWSTVGRRRAETIATLNNLALLLHERGDYAGAQKLFYEIRDTALGLLGASHPHVGIYQHNLARVLRDMGDYTRAESISLQALRIARETQGAGHPEVSARLDVLASIAKNRGDYETAERCYREALEIAEAALGSKHPTVGIRLNNLGSLLWERGNYAAAEILCRRSLSLAESWRGPHHPETGTCLNNLGLLLQAKGDYEGAEPLFRRALAIAEKMQRVPQIATSLENLAGLLEEKGEYDEVEPLYRRALAFARQALPGDHLQLAACMCQLGNFLIEHNKTKEGEELLREELRIAEKREGKESLSVMASLSNLGDVLRHTGRYEDAEKELARAAELAGKLEVGSPFVSFAELRIHQKRYEDAVELLQRSLEIRRRRLEPTDETVGQAINRLAEVYRLMGRDAEAEKVLKQLPLATDRDDSA